MFIQADNIDSDQTARMHRLILVLVGCKRMSENTFPHDAG